MKDDKFYCELNESELKKIIKKYYLEQGRKVTVEIVYIRDKENYAFPRIDIYENVYISGAKLKKTFVLTYEELKDIVRGAFERENIEFMNIVSNAKILKSSISGLSSGVVIADKTFTVIAREKGAVLQKNKNNK